MIRRGGDDSLSFGSVGDPSGEMLRWNRLRRTIPDGVSTRYDRGLELGVVTLPGVGVGPEVTHTFVSSGMIQLKLWLLAIYTQMMGKAGQEVENHRRQCYYRTQNRTLVHRRHSGLDLQHATA